MITKYDRYLIIFYIFLSLSFFMMFLTYGSEVRYLNIYSDGKLYASYNLEEINQDFEEIIKNKRGSVSLLISKEKCSVIDASCKDKLCKKQHSINEVNEKITCLPNRILIEIVSEKNDKVDMVAF